MVLKAAACDGARMCLLFAFTMPGLWLEMPSTLDLTRQGEGGRLLLAGLFTLLRKSLLCTLALMCLPKYHEISGHLIADGSICSPKSEHRQRQKGVEQNKPSAALGLVT